jgi:hypothetical protein
VIINLVKRQPARTSHCCRVQGKSRMMEWRCQALAVIGSGWRETLRKA